MLTLPWFAQRHLCCGRLRFPTLIATVLLAALAALLPRLSLACACGCGVFDVGTASMFPQHAGAMAYFEYDYMDQNQNWSGTRSAPATNNSDQRIQTDFLNAGLQYQFNRSWGVDVQLPYWHRLFNTLDADGVTVDSFLHGAVGDVRIKGTYAGFSADMSTGLSFGLKLPTGDSTYAHFDPDTEIGTGSTNVQLGIYHLGNLSADAKWRYFAQAQWDQPVQHKAIYRPGSEADVSFGAYYEGWTVAPTVRIAPVLQVSGTYRGHDGGLLGHPEDSGYVRALLTPGIEVDMSKLSAYVDVGLPIYRNSSGNQLVSSSFWRLNLSYRF